MAYGNFAAADVSVVVVVVVVAVVAVVMKVVVMENVVVQNGIVESVVKRWMEAGLDAGHCLLSCEVY